MNIPNTFTVDFSITNQCNFNCSYCVKRNMSCGFINKQCNLSTDYCKLLLKRLYKYFYNKEFVIGLKGGEPLLNDDLSKILQIIYMYSNVSRIELYTNGSIAINSLPLDKRLLIIFTYHHNMLVNNKKCLELFINNIKYAVKNNIQYRIYVMMETINDLKFSKEDFDEFKNIVKNIDVDYIYQKYIFPTPWFDIKNFDYSNVNQFYVQKPNEVFPYRIIECDCLGHIFYQCHAISDKILGNAITVDVSKLLSNYGKSFKCRSLDCVCRVCQYKIDNEWHTYSYNDENIVKL